MKFCNQTCIFWCSKCDTTFYVISKHCKEAHPDESYRAAREYIYSPNICRYCDKLFAYNEICLCPEAAEARKRLELRKEAILKKGFPPV